MDDAEKNTTRTIQQLLEGSGFLEFGFEHGCSFNLRGRFGQRTRRKTRKGMGGDASG